MSTGSATDRTPEAAIRLTRSEGSEWWVAQDETTGVVSQGKTRQMALENLDEALAGYHGEGEPPSDEELEELGIDPERNTAGSLDDSEIFD